MDRKFKNELNHCLNLTIPETSEPIPEVSEVEKSDTSTPVSSFE